MFIGALHEFQNTDIVCRHGILQHAAESDGAGVEMTEPVSLLFA